MADLSNFIVPYQNDLNKFVKPYEDENEKKDLFSNDLNAQNEALNTQKQGEAIQDTSEDKNEDLNANLEQSLTGIPYLDKKIQDRTLSAYDAYLAHKYLGVNFAQLNVNAKLKGDLKHTSITQTTKELGQVLNGLKNADEVLKRSDLAGTKTGVDIWLNKKTNGFLGLDEEKARLETAATNLAYATSDAMNNGKATNETRKEAKELFGLGLREQPEVLARTAQAMQFLQNRKNALLADLEAKGASLGIDKTLLQEFNAYDKKIDYLNNKLKNEGSKIKFNFGEYQKHAYGEYIKSQQENNPNLIRAQK